MTACAPLGWGPSLRRHIAGLQVWMGITISRAGFHGDKQGLKRKLPAAGSSESACIIQPNQQGRGAPSPEDAAIVMNHTL